MLCHVRLTQFAAFRFKERRHEISEGFPTTLLDQQIEYYVSIEKPFPDHRGRWKRNLGALQLSRHGLDGTRSGEKLGAAASSSFLRSDTARWFASCAAVRDWIRDVVSVPTVTIRPPTTVPMSCHTPASTQSVCRAR